MELVTHHHPKAWGAYEKFSIAGLTYMFTDCPSVYEA